MTIKQLIQQLQKFHPDQEINYIECSGQSDYICIDDDEDTVILVNNQGGIGLRFTKK